MVGWLVGWLDGVLVGWLAGWLVAWLDDWWVFFGMHVYMLSSTLRRQDTKEVGQRDDQLRASELWVFSGTHEIIVTIYTYIYISICGEDFAGCVFVCGKPGKRQ